MEVNGFQIREALKRWERRKKTADSLFKETLWSFEDAGKAPDSRKVAEEYKRSDLAVARLQELQQKFNSQVNLDVLGQKMTMALAIKILGGAGRLEKMWSGAVTDQGGDRYYRRENSRKADDIYACRTVSQEDCAKLADEAAHFSSALRNAIAVGNTQKVSIGDVPKDIFE